MSLSSCDPECGLLAPWPCATEAVLVWEPWPTARKAEDRERNSRQAVLGAPKGTTDEGQVWRRAGRSRVLTLGPGTGNAHL